MARGYLNRPALTVQNFLPDCFSNRPEPACTGQATSPAGEPTVAWKFWDVSITRSSYAGSALNWERSRSFSPGMGRCNRQRLSYGRTSLAWRRLVAYVVLEPETPPESLDLRRYVKEQLPEYMIPSAFVILDGLPLTRTAKSIAGRCRHQQQSEGAAARSLSLRRARSKNCWPESDRGCFLEQVGIEDNFFELGGHLLLATRVISQVLAMRSRSSCPSRSLFPKGRPWPNLGRGSRGSRLENRRSRSRSWRDAPRDSVLPLSFAQERLWFFDQLEPASAVYNIPCIPPPRPVAYTASRAESARDCAPARSVANGLRECERPTPPSGP